MPKYRYVRNKESNDYTNLVVLEKNSANEVTKSIGLNGVADLTNEQYNRVSQIAVLELVKEPAREDVKENKFENDKK